MSTEQEEAAGVDARAVSLPKIALGSMICLTVCGVLSDAAGRYLRDHAGAPLSVPVANVVFLGLISSAVLYSLFRHLASESQERRDALQKAFSISADAVCVCRAKDGTLLKANGACAALTGYDQNDIVARKAQELDLWRSPPSFRLLVKELVARGTVHDYPISFTAKNGAAKSGLLAASLISCGGEPCVLAIIRDVSELKLARERIEQLSYYDGDTGLPNRNLLMERLNHFISLNIRDHRQTAVLSVGLDGFDRLVDAIGHVGSNAVLRNLAGRLAGALRGSDTVARLHRDELVILLGAELKDADIAIVVAKVEQVFTRPIDTPAGEIVISAQLGIACFPTDGAGGEILLQRSHAAMNQARERGEGVQYYSAALNNQAVARLTVASRMMRGLEEGEFFLCYQPKYADHGREMVGMEALVRWRRDGGIVMPDAFIALAEENGMIVALGDWVLGEACRQNMSWQREGLPAVQVSVNISTRQLRDSEFAGKVDRILRETGLEPRFLELEITESAIMEVSEDIVLKLLHLRGSGVSISIDDFGTGYSSLSYLKHLPVDKIKIDRSFVMDIVGDPDDAAIVDAIISIARAMNLCVIAEGVESRGQLDFLIGRGCSQFQGYFFSQPLAAESFAELMRSGKVASSDGAPAPAPVRRHAAFPARKDLLPALELPPGDRVEPAPQPFAEFMRDVAQSVKPVTPKDTIINVLSRFQLDRELKVLPVVDGELLVGIVNRSTFFEENIIGRQGYAAHINHAKKIKELMEPVQFTFDASTRVKDAAASLQPMISTLRVDNICITDHGSYAGVIDVNRIFKAMTEIQLVLAKGANPLSGLPGNTSIEREICERLGGSGHFDIAYLDIDNFKPFNDFYGFQKGDEIIKRLAEIMETVVNGSPAAAGTFCGHIGGDDFILITESFAAEGLSAQIAAAFDRERAAFHGEEDYAAGGYHALNRKGEYESFPLISLSVGIVNTCLSPVGSYAKLASLSTEVKKAAKKRPGTSIVVDGRTHAATRMVA